MRFVVLDDANNDRTIISYLEFVAVGGRGIRTTFRCEFDLSQ